METPAFQPDARLQKIDADLKRPFLSLTLSNDLEQQWLQKSERRRLRGITLWHAFAIPANLLLLMLDAEAGALETGLQVRLGLVIPIYLISLFLLRQKNKTVREVATCLPSLIFVAGVTIIMAHATPLHADRYEIGIGFLLLFTALAVPYFFRELLFILVGATLANLAVMLYFYGPESNKLALISFNTLVALGGAMFRFIRARDTRNNFLYRLRDEIKNQQLTDLSLALINLSETDELTGLKNRRHIYEILPRLCEQARQKNKWLNAVMIDVDHFKAYNDTAGHDAGDECLKQVSSALLREIEDRGQYVARYGGEEFLSFLLTDNREEAEITAEALRHAVETLQIPHPGLGRDAKVTISVGLSGADGGSSVESKALMIAADQALYAAKEAGRNCVRLLLPGEHPKPTVPRSIVTPLPKAG